MGPVRGRRRDCALAPPGLGGMEGAWGFPPAPWGALWGLAGRLGAGAEAVWGAGGEGMGWSSALLLLVLLEGPPRVWMGASLPGLVKRADLDGCPCVADWLLSRSSPPAWGRGRAQRLADAPHAKRRHVCRTDTGTPTPGWFMLCMCPKP